MSAPTSLPNRTSQGGQIVTGVIVTALLLAVACALPLLPWHLLDPVTRFIGARPLLNAFVKAFIIANVVAVQPLLIVWFERKFAGWMQARLGPMHVGWKGTLQTVADAVKLLTKEDVIPTEADQPLFRLAPYLVFVPTMLTFMVLPFSLTWVGYDYNLSALFV